MDVEQALSQLLLDIRAFPSALLKLAEVNIGWSPGVYKLPLETKRSIEMAEVFNRFGSDKANLHRYHRLYAKILGETPSNILEIGIGSTDIRIPSNMGSLGSPGASLFSWRELFPGGKIFGADIDPAVLINNGGIVSHFLDQTDEDSLREFVKLVHNEVVQGFDLIIDDGLHSPFANILCFNNLVEILKKGGYYVIEDISIYALELYKIAALILRDTFEVKIYEDENCLIFTAKKL